MAEGNEKARIGYEAAISVWTYEANAVWARYNAMLVANSVAMAVIAVTLTSTASHELTLAASIAGIVLCAAWGLLNERGFRYHDLSIAMARSLKEHLGLPDQSPPQEDRLCGPRARDLTYLPISVFILLYIVALVLAVVQLSH